MKNIESVIVRVDEHNIVSFLSEKIVNKLKMKYCFAMSCVCRYRSLSLKEEAIKAEDQEVYKSFSDYSDRVFKRAKRWERYYENIKRKLNDEN